MKKLLSMGMAVLMCMAMATPVMAEEAAGGDKTVTNGDGQEVWLNGSTKKDAELISVVMPTSISFQIATKTADDGTTLILDNSDPATGGVVSATGKFTNNSNRSIDLTLVSVADANVMDATNPTQINGTFLDVLNVYLAPASKVRTDVFADKDNYQLKASVTDRKLGTLGLNGTLEFKVFAEDNAADTTSLTDGSYQIKTIMKVSAAK